MRVSSRTPEGEPNRCPVCGHRMLLEPSRPPGDAPCPACGSLLWFPDAAVPQPTAHEATASATGPNGELIPDGSGAPIALVRSHLQLGRRKSCDICLPYPNVSALHCELGFKDGHWVIRDLDSTNGVMVNGVRVRKAVLHPGDRLSVGKRGFMIRYTPAGGPADKV